VAGARGGEYVHVGIEGLIFNLAAGEALALGIKDQ
jgi:hypothetical protein